MATCRFLFRKSSKIGIPGNQFLEIAEMMTEGGRLRRRFSGKGEGLPVAGPPSKTPPYSDSAR